MIRCSSGPFLEHPQSNMQGSACQAMFAVAALTNCNPVVCET